MFFQTQQRPSNLTHKLQLIRQRHRGHLHLFGWNSFSWSLRTWSKNLFEVHAQLRSSKTLFRWNRLNSKQSSFTIEKGRRWERRSPECWWIAGKLIHRQHKLYANRGDIRDSLFMELKLIKWQNSLGGAFLSFHKQRSIMNSPWD